VKLATRNPKAGIAGVLLLECLVYIFALAIVLGLGFAAFYFCWDTSRALRVRADDITRTLQAGERWRADVRAATGPITVQASPDGQLLEIPHGANKVLYKFEAGQVSRNLAPAGQWLLWLPRVKASHMQPDARSRVTAWRWEVELQPTRAKVRVPPLFTFEAVPPATR
jgi:hypothetical protein